MDRAQHEFRPFTDHEIAIVKAAADRPGTSLLSLYKAKDRELPAERQCSKQIDREGE